MYKGLYEPVYNLKTSMQTPSRSFYEDKGANLGEFQKGLRRGTDQLQAGLYGSIEAAGQAAGSGRLENLGREGYERNVLEANEPVQQAKVSSIYDANGLSDVMDWALGGLGSIVPYAAVTMAGGVIGAAAKGTPGAIAGATAATTPIETGNIYKEVEETTGVRDPGNALMLGSVSAGLNTLGPAAVFKRLSTPGTSRLRNTRNAAVAGTASEGFTEAAQERLAMFASERVDPTYDPFSPENKDASTERLVNATLLGAVGGGVMGGAGGLLAPTQSNGANDYAIPDEEVDQVLDGQETPAAALLPEDMEDPLYTGSMKLFDEYDKGSIDDTTLNTRLNKLFDTMDAESKPYIASDLGRELDRIQTRKQAQPEQSQELDDLYSEDSATYDDNLTADNTFDVEESFTGSDIFGDKDGMPFDEVASEGTQSLEQRIDYLERKSPGTLYQAQNALEAYSNELQSREEGRMDEAALTSSLQKIAETIAAGKGQTLDGSALEFLSKQKVIRPAGKVNGAIAPDVDVFTPAEVFGAEPDSKTKRRINTLERQVAETPTNQQLKEELRTLKSDVNALVSKFPNAALRDKGVRLNPSQIVVQRARQDGNGASKEPYILYAPRMTKAVMDKGIIEGGSYNTQVKNAFREGLGALANKGIVPSNIPGDTVIFNGKDGPITYDDVFYGSSKKSEPTNYADKSQQLREQASNDLVEQEARQGEGGESTREASLIEDVYQPSAPGGEKTTPYASTIDDNYVFKNIGDDRINDFEPKQKDAAIKARRKVREMESRVKEINKQLKTAEYKDRQTLRAERSQIKEDLPQARVQRDKANYEGEKTIFKEEQAARSASIVEGLPRTTLEGLQKLDTKEGRAQVQEALTKLVEATKLGVKAKAMSVKDAIAYAQKNGFGDYIAGLENGSLHGFVTSLRNGEIGVFIHPSLKGAVRREIIAHEFGHVIYRSMFNKLSAENRAAVFKDFDNWLKKYKNRSVADIFGSKKTPKAAMLGMVEAMDGLNVQQLSEKSRDYILDFEEWFADSASKWLESTTTTSTTPAGRFFKRVADALKSIAARLRIRGFAVYGMGESLINSSQDFASLYTGKAQEIYGTAVTATKAAFSNESVHAITHALDTMVPASVKETIERATQGTVKTQIKRIIGNVGESDISARAFQLWRAGMLRGGPKINQAFETLQRKLDTSIGSVAANTATILPESPARSQTELDLAAEQLQLVTERAGNTGGKVVDGLKKFFFLPGERLRSSNIPALVKLSKLMHNKVGDTFNESTMHESRDFARGRYNQFVQRIYKDIKPEDTANIYSLLLDPNKDIGATEAQKLAAKRTFNMMRDIKKYMEKAGVNMGDRGADYFPWVFDSYKVQTQMSQAEFVNTIRSNVKLQPGFEKEWERVNVARRKEYEAANDNTKGFKELGKTEFLQQIYENLTENYGVVTGTSNDVDPNPNMRSSNRRVLDFIKDDPTVFEQFKGMMSDDMGMTLGSYVNNAVKQAEYTRRFGQNGEMLEAMLSQAKTEGAKAEDIVLARDYVNAMMGVHGQKTARWLSDKWGMSFPAGRPISPNLQKYMGWMMVYQNVRLLGLATLTSFADPMGIAVRTGRVDLAFHGMKEAFKAAINKDPNQTKALAEMLGIIDYNVVNDSLGWEYGGIYMSTGAKKVNETFFKWTGLQAWTRTTRVAATASGLKFIGHHAQGNTKDSQRYLAELNLKDSDVIFDENGNVKILSYTERKDASEAEISRDDKVRAALFRFVDESILRPNPAQRPLWASDPHYMLIFHLKSFMYSFHDRILKRVWNEASKHKNYAPFIGLLSYVPIMIAADLLRDLIQHGGESPRKANWGPMDYAVNGVFRAGLPGVPGMTAYDLYKDYQYGGIPGSSLTGPTVEQITDFKLDKAYPLQTFNFF